MTSDVNHRATGYQYEQTAAEYLIKQGLHLIEKNFFCRCGELDLVMKEKSTLVFVEVKYRKNRSFGHAAEAVTPTKSKKLIKTALFWLKKYNLSPYTTDFRFDIVAIHHYGADIDWYKNAITQE